MDISTLGIILGIVSIIITVFLSFASLYQGSVPTLRQTQILTNSSEEPKRSSLLKSTLIIIIVMALGTALVFLVIEGGFIPFIIWLNSDTNGWRYVLLFSALVAFLGTIMFLVWKGRRS